MEITISLIALILCWIWIESIVVLSTILAAVITPSTDPLTQIIMTTALLILYLGGAGFVILLKK